MQRRDRRRCDNWSANWYMCGNCVRRASCSVCAVWLFVCVIMCVGGYVLLLVCVRLWGCVCLFFVIVHVNTSICVCVCVCVCTCVFAHMCLFVGVYVCVYLGLYVRLWVFCVFVCVCVCGCLYYNQCSQETDTDLPIVYFRLQVFVKQGLFYGK